MLDAAELKYDSGGRARGVGSGGVALMLRVAQELGLTDAIDRRLQLLKAHCPYYESDHVLDFAFNALCGGTCLQEIELRRHDDCYLDSLGAETIPDPTNPETALKAETKPDAARNNSSPTTARSSRPAPSPSAENQRNAKRRVLI